MSTLSERKPIKVDPPTPHEKVLRLLVSQIKNNYKSGWLYHRSKEKGLLEAYQDYSSKGVFTLLKGDVGVLSSLILTIELVPKTCWFSNVRSNVTSDQWNQLKKKVSQRAAYRCQICNGVGPKWPVECHEIWEYSDERLIQELKGLIALCPSCHKVKHIGFAQISGKEDETICHLAIINGWTYKSACRYVEKQFKIWRDRSKYDWLLDVLWLDNFDINVDVKDRVDSVYQDCKESEKEYYIAHRKEAADLFREGVDHYNDSHFEEAEKCFIEASEYGDIYSALNVAGLHLEKKLSYPDYDKGLCFLKRAARLGHEDSKKMLALDHADFKRCIGEEVGDQADSPKNKPPTAHLEKVEIRRADVCIRGLKKFFKSIFSL